MTVWCSVAFSAATASTAKVGSVSPGSFEHAAERHNVPAIASVVIHGARLGFRLGRGEDRNAGRFASVIGLEAPGHSLQRCDGQSITRLSVGVRVARLREGILSVHDFKDRGFSGLITHAHEPKTFAGKLCRLLKRLEFGTGSFGFVIERARIGEQLALRKA